MEKIFKLFSMISNFYKKETFPKKITPNLFVLGSYYFNSYLLLGKYKSALVELGVSATVEHVIKQLKFLKVKPDFLILTHPDSDHITGWNYLKLEFPDATLILAKDVENFINRKKIIDFISKEDEFMHQQFRKLRVFPVNLPIKFISKFENHMVIKKSTTINLGELTIKCIPVQGHAIGNIIIEVPKNNIVLVSDCLGVEHDGVNIPFFFKNYLKYLFTIEKIIDLKPQIVCPAHYGPYCDRDAERAMNRAKQSAIRLHKIINKSKDEEHILVKKIFDSIYCDGLKLFSKNSIMQCVRTLIYRAKVN